MKTAHVTSFLTEYMDGTLSTFWSERVKSHLIFCNACRQHLNDLENNVRRLKTVTAVSVPAELEKRIIARATQELKSPGEQDPLEEETTPPMPSWVMRGMVLMAAALIVGLVIREMPKHLQRSGFQQTSSGPVAANGESRGVKPEAPAPAKEAPSLHPPVAGVRRKEATAGKSLEQTSLDQASGKTQGVPADSAVTMKGATAAPARASEAPKEGLRAVAKKDIEVERQDAAGMGTSGNKVAAFSDRISDSKLKSSSDLTEITGFSSGFSQPSEHLITSQESWTNLWGKIYQNQSSKPPLPAVDFKTNSVVAVFIGDRPSSGYSVEILGIEPTTWQGKPARIVAYKVNDPLPGTMRATVMTQPYALKVVPKFKGSTFFQKRR